MRCFKQLAFIFVLTNCLGLEIYGQESLVGRIRVTAPRPNAPFDTCRDVRLYSGNQSNNFQVGPGETKWRIFD